MNCHNAHWAVISSSFPYNLSIMGLDGTKLLLFANRSTFSMLKQWQLDSQPLTDNSNDGLPSCYQSFARVVVESTAMDLDDQIKKKVKK